MSIGSLGKQNSKGSVLAGGGTELADDEEPGFHDEIIHQAYASAVEPERTWVFLRLMIDQVFKIFQKEKEVLADSPHAPSKRQKVWQFHMENAAALLERQETRRRKRELEQRNSIDDLLIQIDETGRITSATKAAQKLFSVKEGDDLDAFKVDGGSEHLRDMVTNKKRNDEPGGVSLVKFFSAQDERWIRMALSMEADFQGVSSITMRAAETIWNEKTGRAFQRAYSITDAELAIVKATLHGTSLVDLGKQRKRSANTIRAQSRTLFAKLSINSQIELTRLYSAFRHTGSVSENRLNIGTVQMIKLADGREIEVRLFGPTNGTPVLLVHTFLTGMRLPKRVINEINRRGYRVILPCRAGYARSTLCENGQTQSDAANDMIAVLDALKIERCPVIANFTGHYFALTMIKIAPDRVTSLTTVSGMIPLTTRTALGRMAPIFAASCLGVRYLPLLVKFVVRAHGAYTEGLPDQEKFKDEVTGSPSDLALFDKEDFLQTICLSRRDTLAQGTQTYANECIQLSQSDARHMPDTDLPVALVYGEEDMFTPPQNVVEFCETNFPDAIYFSLPNTGRLALFQRPDIVFDAVQFVEELAELGSKTRPSRKG